MRHGTAILLVAALAFAGVDDARAAETDASEPTSFRNPIEWLLSDLGKLISGTVHSVAAKPAQDTTKSAKSSEAPPAPSAPVEEQDAGGAAAAEKSAGFRNPITWLFSDLARIFKPDLEIEQAKKTPPVETGATAAVQTEIENPAAPASIEIAAEATPEQTTTEASTSPADTKTSNPIGWLFRDLARFFTPDTAPAESETAKAPIAVAEKPATTDAPTAIAVQPPAEVIATRTVSEIATPRPAVEIGPWVPRPEHDPFDPGERLFASTGKPLLAAPTPAQAVAEIAKPVQIAETADTTQTPTNIRERPPYRPERRNHAALGHDYKAVTPGPQDDSLLDRVLANLFGIDDPVEAEETIANKISERIVPEEKLDLGYISPDAATPEQELTTLEGGPLSNLDLYMGKDSVIGAAYDKKTFKTEACVERALHGSVFCLKQLNWPAEIAASFNADTAFVLPGEGVVRFENGTVSRVYTVFNAPDFTDVVKYMQHRFGPPQEREVGWMHMLEAPKMPNTTFRWKAISADRRDVIVLEVRNYDDLRRSFADMDHGMVRLYRDGSRPIFKHISTMDLMLMQRRRVANAPVEVNAPPKQQ